MHAARSNAVRRDHGSAARFAAPIANCASLRPPCGTSAITSPVAGESAVNVSPLSEPVHRPSTNIAVSVRVLVAKLGPPAVDVRLQLVLQPLVQLRFHVLLERLFRDLRRA